MTTGIDAVLEVLEASGFERLPKPLVVAGAIFDFEAAVRGTGVSNDLVVVAARTTPPRRLVQLLSGLSRILDQVQSRRPVTLVLIGMPSAGSTMTELERQARVLAIANENPDTEEVRSAVAVLLPLTLPRAMQHGREPLDEVAATLGSTLSEEQQALIARAKAGPEAVRDALRAYVDEGARGEVDEQARS